jgi:hypothetical protein
LNLHELIQSRPNWFNKTAEELFTELNTPSVEFVDTAKWTWAGIADVFIPETNKRFGRAGNKQLQDAMLASGEHWAVQQLSAGFALYDDEILDLFRQLDAGGIVPGARHIANAIKRTISLLEENTLSSTQEEVAVELADCKLERLKQLKNDEGYDTHQSYREAITLWDGSPETEPKLWLSVTSAE